MINSIQKLYETQSLDGAIFTTPLLRYRGWIISKESQNKTKLSKIIFKITHFISGIIIYPPIVAFAALGVCINLYCLLKLAPFVLKQRDRIEKLAREIVILENNKSSFDIDERDTPAVFGKDSTKFTSSVVIIHLNDHRKKCHEIRELIFKKGEIYQKIWLNIYGSVSTSGSIRVTIIESVN